MSHFIVKTDNGKYLQPRRRRKDMGCGDVARTTFGTHLWDARVFNTKAAAVNAARDAWKGDFYVIGITLDVNNEADATLYERK